MESAEHRTIQVKVLQRESAAAYQKSLQSYRQKLQQSRRLAKQTYDKGVQKWNTGRLRAQESYKQILAKYKVRRKRRKIIWKNRRQQAWNVARDLVFSSKKAISKPPLSLPLPIPTGASASMSTALVASPSRWRDRVEEWTEQTTASLQDRYRRWKSRKSEEYQGWKGRRKEQYQVWKVRRQEQWRQLKLLTKSVILTEYSKAEWFDSMGRPLTARDATGRFVNPWQSQSTNGVNSLETLLAWRLMRMQRNIAQWGALSSLYPRLSWMRDAFPPLLAPVPPLPSPKVKSLQLTWIGHSTCLVQMNGLTILTDPMFSLRASPSQWLPVGVPRDLPPSHSIEELAKHCGGCIDVCTITHDHYDHMDKESITQLKDKVKMWVVPLGISAWLQEKCHVDPAKVVELEWWQHVLLQKLANDQVSVVEGNINQSKETKLIKITACPTQHWASRTMSDRNLRLWCSFAMETRHHKFFNCGDTGYPQFPLFRQIGDALGPFDLATIPIGAYEPRFMMKEAHIDPAEAILIHKQLRSRRSIGVHWGTFALSEEALDDPPKLLDKMIRQGTFPLNFRTIPHGSTVQVETAVKDEEEDDDHLAFVSTSR